MASFFARMRPTRPLTPLLAVAALGLVGMLPSGRQPRAADPQTYTVQIEGVADAPLAQALRDSSSLVSLRESSPVGPFALLRRAEGDLTRLTTALQSFGHYGAAIRAEVMGRPLDDPALPPLLDEVPETSPVAVVFHIEPGPVYTIGTIRLTGEPPPEAAAALELGSGAPALAPQILAARSRALRALRESGHAFAEIGPPQGSVNNTDGTLDVTMAVTAGPVVEFGEIQLSGLERVMPDYVRERITLRPGARYDPRRLEAERADLARLGVFSAVRVRAGEEAGADGRVPLTFEFTERPPRAIRLGASYSTDVGAGLSASWSHRNLFGRAEQLTLSAEVTQLGSQQSDGLGYRVGALFVKPDFLWRDVALRAELGAVRESLEAYDRDALTAGLGLDYRLSPQLTLGVGLAAEIARITQDEVETTYNLIGVPLTLKWDTTGDLLDPKHGVRVVASITPTQSLGGTSGTFVVGRVTGSTYIDGSSWLGQEEGRTILATRLSLGTVVGAEAGALPPIAASTAAAADRFGAMASRRSGRAPSRTSRPAAAP